MDASEDTMAEEIFRRCNNDMLKPMLTRTNSNGSSGAPSHPVAIQIAKYVNQSIITFSTISLQRKVNKAE